MDVIERVLEILREINPKISDNVEEDLLKNGLIDSFEIVNVVMGLEDTFEIEIDPELIIPANFQTVANIVKLVEDLLDN